MDIPKHHEEIIAYCIVNTIILWVIFLVVGYLFSLFADRASFFDFLVNPATWVALAGITTGVTKIGITLLALPKEHKTSNEIKKIICLSVGTSMGITMLFFALLKLVSI